MHSRKWNEINSDRLCLYGMEEKMSKDPESLDDDSRNCSTQGRRGCLIEVVLSVVVRRSVASRSLPAMSRRGRMQKIDADMHSYFHGDNTQYLWRARHSPQT
ncbi:hypothetical protein M404DRAFT_380591 [Pisolithus tinctorius Marx 270]|uniref:Uncharacterized protein n=1 Tax=Pisolithus tinctorius Marx 270 TaxID=870435 RepID=A0A0C3IBT9_PISTI|nr:hypothetical protein M404DRAFT_380591 [Pisolithus tinctorius Marx 270]